MPSVLIVDDNPDMLNRLGRIVSQVDENLQIVQVLNADDAYFEIDKNARVTIAIVDVYLSEPQNHNSPEGLGLVRHLRCVQPDCFNILFSSQVDDTSKLSENVFQPDLIDQFVSAWYGNRDWRSQLRQAIISGRLRAV